MAHSHTVPEGAPEARRAHPPSGGPVDWPFRSVLAAVNPYLNSEVAARYAIPFAKACAARLSFVFVAEAGEDKREIHRAESALGRLSAEARDEGLDAEILVLAGDPRQTIGRHVRERGVDLVFAATRREDVSRRFFSRTVSRGLLRDLPSAVAVVRAVHLGKIFPKTILVPLRGRMTQGEERAAFVAALARGFGSEAVLFHVERPISRFFRGEVPPASAEGDAEISPEVEFFRERLARLGVPLRKRAARGAVARSITIEAAHRRSDLIIMEAGEDALRGRLLGGDPVEEVLRETPCNLIVYRPSRRSP